MKVCKHDRVLRCVDCENENLRSKVEEMQKALEWYADEENYKRSEDDHQTGYPHEIMWDKGSKARQALKGSQ